MKDISPKTAHYRARPPCVQIGTHAPIDTKASRGMVRDIYGDLARNQVPFYLNF